MTERLVAMTFEEASRWIAAQEARIAALEARCQQADAILAIVKRHAEDAMADDDVELDGDAQVMMMALARYYRDYPPETACEHDWKTFMGSSRQLTVCTKCGAKQETPVESREPMTPDDWEYWPEKPIHSMSVHHRGRIVDGIWRCWDCPATHDVEYAQKIKGDDK